MEDARPKEPNQRDLAAAEARTRILSAAADCIVRDGLAKVRMAGIAKAAGVSAGLLHYHFDTKEQLFADVLTYSHDVSTLRNEHAVPGGGQGAAQRLSLFLDRCLPSDARRSEEWLLWQELALLCIRQPELAKVASELYEDLYSTVTGLIVEGTQHGVFAPAIDARKLAETAVALCDGLGARVLANDPHLTLDEARASMAATMGMLVGYDGPLPEPDEMHRDTHMTEGPEGHDEQGGE